jgi:hypothetical protein
MSEPRPSQTGPSGASSYAGDLGSTETWEGLSREKEAQLVDVRTEAECKFMGAPRSDGNANAMKRKTPNFSK